MFISAAQDAQPLYGFVVVMLIGLAIAAYGAAMAFDVRGFRTRKRTEWDRAMERARLGNLDYTPPPSVRAGEPTRLNGALMLAGGIVVILFTAFLLAAR